MVITINKSRTFRIDQPFKTAVVGSPEIADARPISDRVIYIQGKKIGTTNLVAFDEDMKVIGVMDIEVTPDTRELQDKIQSSGGRGIRVSSSNGKIVLSGEAGNAVAADRAVSLAKSMQIEGSTQAAGVVNAMTIAQAQQVMLKVRFLGGEPSSWARPRRELVCRQWIWHARRYISVAAHRVRALLRSALASGIPLFQAAGTLVSGSQPFGVALASLVNNGNSVDLMLSALEHKGSCPAPSRTGSRRAIW